MLSIDNNYIDAYFNRAVCQQKLNNYKLSADFKVVYDLDSTRSDALFEQAVYSMDNNYIKEAEELFSQILVLFPNHAKSAYELGVLHYLQKDFSSAITAFTKCLAIDNQHAYALNDRGSCYRLIEEFDKAEKDYLSAIDLDPKSFMYNNLGAIYKLKGTKCRSPASF